MIIINHLIIIVQPALGNTIVTLIESEVYDALVIVEIVGKLAADKFLSNRVPLFVPANSRQSETVEMNRIGQKPLVGAFIINRAKPKLANGVVDKENIFFEQGK